MAVETGMKEIRSVDEIPDFTTEEEEVEFWATHSLGDGVELKTRETSDHPLPPPRERSVTVDLPEHILEQLREVAQERGVSVRRLLKTLGEVNAKRSGPIAVRFEDDTVTRLKVLAERKGMGYQTLLKAFVQERLYEEEKREGLIGAR